MYAERLTGVVLDSAKACIPNKVVRIKPSDVPWMNQELKLLIRRRKRAYRIAKRTNTTCNWSTFRRLRNVVVSKLRASKSEYLASICEKIMSTRLSSKDWWKTIISLIKPTQSTSIPPLIDSNTGETVYNEEDKANLLNTYFASQALVECDNHNVPNLENSTESLLEIIVSPEEVKDALDCLHTGKASGPDNLNNRILRELSDQLSSPLCDLFNLSLQCRKVPNKWKIANVCAVLKKGDPSVLSNYRPISLLNSLEKVFERIIFKHVFNFLRGNSFFTSSQSGFMPGDSTINQLSYLYNNFCKALDDGLEVRVVFFDISKAFDKVWHQGLLAKLYAAGIRGNLFVWFSDYLCNRQQRVTIPGGTSVLRPVCAGVPQGSILGPLLFLIYINDIVCNIHSNVNLFADDTSLHMVVRNPSDTARLMQDDIARISSWADDWLVKFNPFKSESMVVSRKRNKPVHPPLTMLDAPIINVDSHKHLGLTLSSDGSWHTHINFIKEKAWTRINMIRCLKYTLNRKSLETLYLSFIRPVIEYADVVWDNCSAQEGEDIEKIQYEAARIITGCTRLVSINDLLLESGLEPLSERRKKHRLILFYKMVKGISPQYLSSLVPQITADRTTYRLRNVDNITNIKTRTTLYNSSFLPKTISEWNSLPVETRNATSVNIFKASLNSDRTRPNKLYYHGQRKQQVIHTQLRTGCSPLAHHLFTKNIVASPDCRCGSIESTQHFFLHCPLYHNIRQVLINTITGLVGHITIEIILYGDHSSSVSVNRNIFDAVHGYIDQSGRFD